MSNIFTFWEGPLPAYIRLCLQTWKFPFTVLNYSNLRQYTDLPADNRLKRFTLPQIADCVRVHVLRDQGGYPNSIDVHITDKLPENRQGATNYGLIMDTTDKVAWFCAGNPSEGEFREYRI